MDRNSFESKKVFFLYPHSVIQQELLSELVANEYAVYLVTDHIKFRKILNDYREPIIFINIDDYLSEDEWKDYVSEIMESDDNDARVGILTYNDDTALAQWYLMDLMIACGFIKLKLGLEQSKKIILRTLEANEAKGRRRYLRIDCGKYKNTELNVQINGSFVNGKILDISSVGMAFLLNKSVSIAKHSVLSDIQIKLRGKIARISGPVMGSRTTPEGDVHVLLFAKDTSPDTRSRIHTFIYETLQIEINGKISSTD